jgi:elongation factor P
MISTGELRKGVTIELDNELWKILDYHHIKMGRGSAQVRITLRNVKRGQTIERSFQAGTKWPLSLKHNTEPTRLRCIAYAVISW